MVGVNRVGEELVASRIIHDEAPEKCESIIEALTTESYRASQATGSRIPLKARVKAPTWRVPQKPRKLTRSRCATKPTHTHAEKNLGKRIFPPEKCEVIGGLGNRRWNQETF